MTLDPSPIPILATVIAIGAFGVAAIIVWRRIREPRKGATKENPPKSKSTHN